MPLYDNDSMPEQTFKPGDETFFASDFLTAPHGAAFEDDGETGYFYAMDLSRSDNMILDAVHIYNVANITHRALPSTLSILWSNDGTKCALMINGFAHAAFDFTAQRGYCRTNYPNFPVKASQCWPNVEHIWSDDAISWLN